MTPPPFDLAKLLNPYDIQVFTETYWEQQYLLLERNDGAYYETLITTTDLDIPATLSTAMNAFSGDSSELESLGHALEKRWSIYAPVIELPHHSQLFTPQACHRRFRTTASTRSGLREPRKPKAVLRRPDGRHSRFIAHSKNATGV